MVPESRATHTIPDPTSLLQVLAFWFGGWALSLLCLPLAIAVLAGAVADEVAPVPALVVGAIGAVFLVLALFGGPVLFSRAIAAVFRGRVDAEIRRWTGPQFILVSIVACLVVLLGVTAVLLALRLSVSQDDFAAPIRPGLVLLGGVHVIAPPIVLYRLAWIFFERRKPGAA